MSILFSRVHETVDALNILVSTSLSIKESVYHHIQLNKSDLESNCGKPIILAYNRRRTNSVFDYDALVFNRGQHVEQVFWAACDTLLGEPGIALNRKISSNLFGKVKLPLPPLVEIESNPFKGSIYAIVAPSFVVKQNPTEDYYKVWLQSFSLQSPYYILDLISKKVRDRTVYSTIIYNGFRDDDVAFHIDWIKVKNLIIGITDAQEVLW